MLKWIFSDIIYKEWWNAITIKNRNSVGSNADPSICDGKMLEAFEAHINPAQSMLLFTKPKKPKKTWTEHFLYLVSVAEVSGGAAEYMVLNNIVQYASEGMRVALMAKVDAHRTDYLQQAEELAHFAQALESGTKKLLPIGVSNVVRESRF
uniref:Uncharacterized protein AlNc14C516G12020 n=1 Tax=Albugo laibachii Nc14 TaxID=890382 RepID=F0X0S6_9STRA|nr:conserved hypothetical protein [Albugo laibachii Nc14]|eukprot:CCA27370.1 conserved hypothetical protein [Albugo laibachii Nc14]